jgi:hypothetical protein
MCWRSSSTPRRLPKFGDSETGLSRRPSFRPWHDLLHHDTFMSGTWGFYVRHTRLWKISNTNSSDGFYTNGSLTLSVSAALPTDHQACCRLASHDVRYVEYFGKVTVRMLLQRPLRYAHTMDGKIQALSGCRVFSYNTCRVVRVVVRISELLLQELLLQARCALEDNWAIIRQLSLFI